MLLLLTFGVQAQQVTQQTTNQLLVDSQKSSLFDNSVPQSNLKAFNLAINDSSGLGVFLVAMIVIFIVLIVLFLFFKLFAIISIRSAENRKAKLTGVKASESEHIPGEVYAAISMALYELSNDAHDIEHAVLTIERTRRPYSPWSSKIYGMRQLPGK